MTLRLLEPSAAVVAIDSCARKAASGMAQSRTRRRLSLFAAMIAHRLPEALAHALADDAAKLGHDDESRALAAALETRMRARPIDYVHSNAILLKGVNGAGKTSVAAKIAAQAFLTGRKVKLLTANANAPRLADLASRLDVKIVATSNAQTMARAVSEAHKRDSLVVIDTSGFDARRAKARAAFEALGQIGEVDTIAVVSALYDAAEMGELVHALGAQRVIVTGVDLARRAGALAVAATSGPPLAHVARSPFAGDGLEPLTPHALAQSLVAIRPGHN